MDVTRFDLSLSKSVGPINLLPVAVLPSYVFVLSWQVANLPSLPNDIDEIESM